MSDAALILIAVAQAILVVLAVRRELRPPTIPAVTSAPVPLPEPRRYPDVYIQLPCGIAVLFDGRTENCARRKRHQGRCMCEDELAVAADQTVLVTAPQDASRDVDVAALGRHVDECPTTLHQNDRLSIDEQAWLLRTRLMVDALVTGERFSEWGETRA